VKLDALGNHLAECEYNPKKVIQCENGCGMMISKDDLQVKNLVDK
jgi:E3 ubiquitin-protein ligase NRDP1